MTFAEVHVKRSVILTDRLGPDILQVLTMKRTFFKSFDGLTFMLSSVSFFELLLHV